MRLLRTASPPFVLCALLTAAGCGEAGQAGAEPDRGEASARDGSAAATPAHYLSAFAFTGGTEGSTRLLLETINRSSGFSLAREYRGWIAEGGAWSRFLELRDTLPVPRAAWRILPGGGLAIRIGNGSEIVGLSHSGRSGRFELRPTRVLAEWTGPTGQRELLALAALERDSVSRPGLLHVRRAARTGDPQDAEAADRILLLADARGDGLLVARAEREATPTFAWGWVDGVRSRWTDVTLERLETDEEGTAWTLAIPSAGIAARLEAVPTDPAGSAPPSATLLRGTLETPGASRAVHGLTLLGRLP